MVETNCVSQRLVTHWYLLSCSDKRRGYVKNKSQENETCASTSPFIHQISIHCVFYTKKLSVDTSFILFWDPQNKAQKSTTQAVPPPLAICLEEMDSVHLTIAVSLPQCRIWHNFLSSFFFRFWPIFVSIENLFVFFKADVYGINLNNSVKLEWVKFVVCTSLLHAWTCIASLRCALFQFATM